MKKCLGPILLLLLSVTARSENTLTVTVQADAVIAEARRADLMGINIALYNDPDDYRKAIEGPIGELATGLVRMPGGSASDKFYWNGNGVIQDGVADPARFQAPYWQVDYSAYQPGFVVDNHDWSKAGPGYIRLDARDMHELTRKHPMARNLVTVNAGSGTPEMAAEWVRWANIVNDFGVTYWEIGNELNGEWEAGHIRPDGSKMTAEKYVEIFTAFAKAMKAVDPTIKVGGPSCDVRHHEDYFEPLLRLAGEHVDFLTIHFYSLRNSLAPEEELFDGLSALKPFTDRLQELVEQYQPDRADEIEVSITEWNSKLPKDQDAYRLFNGLWFSAWIGEMMREGLDSATVWDLFSGADNGHGLLVKKGDEYVPTGRYWAFWLWSHFMADTMVQSAISENPDVHVHATRNDDSLYVLLMNESRETAYPVTLDLDGFRPAKSGTEVTLSSREYFWNPYAGQADWNFGPRVEDRKTANGMQVVIPPYCVKVFAFSSDTPDVSENSDPGEPELRLLLPDHGFGDLEVEGWVRAFHSGSDQPFAGNSGTVRLSVEGNATVEPAELPLSQAAARFVVKPNGPGTVTVTATGGERTARHAVDFREVVFEEQIVWDFESGALEEPAESHFGYAVSRHEASGRGAVRIDLPGVPIEGYNNNIFAPQAFPRGVQKERIGGLVFDLLLPDELELDDPDADMQVILQSHGAYWIPCGHVDVSKDRGTWRTLRLEIPDKTFLKVMDQAFSIRFIMATRKPVKGPIYIDNLGVLLRPEN